MCERTNCPQRAVPPLKRKLKVDPGKRTALPYTLIAE
ncbi:short-chain fatty acyl-CoA regulator family protein [Mesorhizobium sp. 2RAF21]